MKDLLTRNWFLVGIICSIILAEIYPELGKTGGVLVPEWTAKFLAVSLIFLLSGISLSLNDFAKVARKFKIHAFIQLFTFVVIPLLIQFLNIGLAFLFNINTWILKGLITVGCMPPPISSAVILTKAIGGNEAAAVFNSVLGSFLGIIITPILLLFFLGTTALVETLNSVFMLSATVIFPLVSGLCIRHFKLINSLHKLPSASFGQFLLLFIIYTSFCDAFLTYDAPMSATDILSSIILVIAVQLALLYTTFHFSVYLKIYSASDIAAITFCSTHKSLTLGLPILRILFSGYSHFSQITLPLLIYHPTQIILGGILVPPFKKWVMNNSQKRKLLP